jgi:GLPGLI family protein
MITFFSCFLLFGQNLRIAYEVEGKLSKNDTLKHKDLMMLSIDTKTKESVYENYRKPVKKKSGDLAERLYKEVILNESKNYFDKIYKDKKSSQYFTFYSVNHKFYKVPYIFPVNKWKLENETRNFMTYLCKKASISFGGRNWIAWYTSDIPVSDGPYKFSGLPGLILEISSSDGDYHFIMKELSKEDLKIIYLPKSTETDDKKLIKLKNDLISDPSLYLRQLHDRSDITSTATFNGTELKVDREYFEKKNKDFWEWMKKHDNPIEENDIWIK